MCNILEIKKGSGNTKIAQLKEFEYYVKYEKRGNKFYIIEIYDRNIEYNNNKKVYSTYIQSLVLDLLVEYNLKNKGKTMTITSNSLMFEINMVNNNYIKYNNMSSTAIKNDIQKNHSVDLDIYNISDFYMVASKKFKQAIRRALDSLVNKRLINYKKVMMLAYKDYLHRHATDSIERKLLNIEKELLLKYDCDNIMILFLKGKHKQFYKEVVDIFNKKYMDEDGLQLEYYYTAYDIIMGDYLTREKNIVDTYLLEHKEELKCELNKIISESVKEGYYNRHKRAIDELNNFTLQEYLEINKFKKEKINERSDSKYIKQGNKLTEINVT